MVWWKQDEYQARKIVQLKRPRYRLIVTLHKCQKEPKIESWCSNNYFTLKNWNSTESCRDIIWYANYWTEVIKNVSEHLIIILVLHLIRSFLAYSDFSLYVCRKTIMNSIIEMSIIRYLLHKSRTITMFSSNNANLFTGFNSFAYLKMQKGQITANYDTWTVRL